MLREKELYLGLCYEEPTVNAAGAVTDSHEINQLPNYIDHRQYERTNITDKLSTTYQSHSQGDETSTDHKYYRVGNNQQISFFEAVRAIALSNANTGGNWETAAYWALWTSNEASATPFVWGELDEPVTVGTHEVFIIRNGHLEVYLEPDAEYLYYGIYADEMEGQTVVKTAEQIFRERLNEYWYTDSEGSLRHLPHLPQGLHIVSNTSNSRGCHIADIECPDDSDEKTYYLFFASPVDFKGTAMFRADDIVYDANGDRSYTNYGYEQSDVTTYIGSYFKGMNSDLMALTQIPASTGGAPSFTSDTQKGVESSYVGPYYKYENGEYVELESEPAGWDAAVDPTYTNFFYRPQVILVNRENAYFVYQVNRGLPTKVAVPSGNPSTQGYYEVRNSKVNQYIKSTDTTVDANKTYYTYAGVTEWTKVPTYVKNKYYTEDGGVYTIVSSDTAPEGWEENYTDYYIKTSSDPDTYEAVTDATYDVRVF